MTIRLPRDLVWGIYGIETPEKEYRFAPPRKFRFDFSWTRQKIAVEIEGGVWSHGRHTRGQGYLADMEKYNLAGASGWRVFRFTPDQLREGTAQEFMRSILKPKGE
jgi:very-short-patch-repair endonuclease